MGLSRRLSVLILCAAAAFAGYALAPVSAPAAEKCDVLRKGEVEKAIDAKVKVGPPADGIGGKCSFIVREHPADVVKVWVLEGDDAKTGFDVGTQLAGKHSKVRGFGDKAVYTGDPFSTLYVLDGDTLVYLQYYEFSGSDSPAKIRRAVFQMTRKVLKRV